MASVRSRNDHDIIVSVLGGCITGVFTDIPDAKVVIVDWDDLNAAAYDQPSGRSVKDWPLAIAEMPNDTRQAYENSAAHPSMK